MKYLISSFLILSLTLPPVSLMAYQSRKDSSSHSKNKIFSEAGLNIPKWGVAVDAIYDERLDNLVPGYKILNVVVTNKTNQTIFFDPQKDKWAIKDNVGKKHNAINHLRFSNEQLWFSLPQELREKLEYPQAVRTGNIAKIDIFFPLSTELKNFREINWKSSFFNKEFVLLETNENNLTLDPKEERIYPDKKTYNLSRQKYEGTDEDTQDEDTQKETQKKSSTKKDMPQFDPSLDDFTITVD